MTYGLRLNDALDTGMTKSVILLEVVTLNSNQQLNFKYGNFFKVSDMTDPGSGPAGTSGIFFLQYPSTWPFGVVPDLFALVRTTTEVASVPQVYIPTQGSVYAGVQAYGRAGFFEISFIRGNIPPTEIYVYGLITEGYRQTGYGMNVYNSSGELTFSTKRPLLKDLVPVTAPNWKNRLTTSTGILNGMVVSQMNSLHVTSFGLTADMYGFSPMITPQGTLFSALTVFQGSVPLMNQTQTPTRSFMSYNTLVAEI